jgi:anti-sigma factor RsiW
MTENFQCGDNAALIGYIYGECEPGERQEIEQHLRMCPACVAEVDALGATRTQLAAWRPPEVQLGFRMVADTPDLSAPPAPAPDGVEATVLRPARWWSRPIPVWAQAAAATLIFASGLSLGVWRGNASPDGTSVMTSVTTPLTKLATPTTAVGAASTSTTTMRNVASTNDLAALEQRLHSEIEAMRAAAAAPQSVSQTASTNEAQILARVRALIDESEQRQQRELALRTAQVVRDFDSQRRVDLQNVRSIVGQVEGSTGAEIARQQQTLQYLMRVSQQP